MNRRVIFIIGGIIILFIFLNFSPCQENKKDIKGNIFKSVHLVNLYSDGSELELLKILKEFNKVITELGYPNIKYRLWKERGDRQGTYKYFFESTWPNQETYEQIHNTSKYKNLVEKYEKRYKLLFRDESYSRYIPLN